MAFSVYRTPVFNDKIASFSDEFKKQIDGFEDQLAENPHVGKPLGFRWFREKKLGKYRMYYLIYEEIQAVYIITLSAKKDQQKMIDTVMLFLDQYKQEIEQVHKTS